MEQKALDFGKEVAIKNSFHKCKKKLVLIK